MYFPRMLTGRNRFNWYQFEKNGHIYYFFKDSIIVLYNNARYIEPAEMDNQVNIMKSSILSVDDRRNRWKLGDHYQV